MIENDEQISTISPVHSSNSDQLIRIFGVSDLHVDHEENWEVISKWKNLNFNKETGLKKKEQNNF